eukprot:CAMPEP_0173393182 /NCGR_PEP_ID=MMETSP1356-20130122/21963_1 /TAXON_ID=77927 ORGANISM="Hemiselmis virescens, Strain PCC157" /NCGR_SAMPLE_ID=MMETSP1356 /ASSEMBLY_ACC=CAM_ASM_000847 /LENGTH=109 /DNA_ID=CAMNT_0014351165 /DNA_START=285 /DNA_END=611 /DNA_ORIENTATION=+
MNVSSLKGSGCAAYDSGVEHNVTRHQVPNLNLIVDGDMVDSLSLKRWHPQPLSADVDEGHVQILSAVVGTEKARACSGENLGLSTATLPRAAALAAGAAAAMAERSIMA